MKNALFIRNGKVKENDCEDSVTFVASTGWLQWFMCRNGLSLRQKSLCCTKGSSRLIYKHVSYILHVKCFAAKYSYSSANIIPMDEAPVWPDMVSDTTLDKTSACIVAIKSTVHEKCRVSVCLTAKVDGSKLKPFIV